MQQNTTPQHREQPADPRCTRINVKHLLKWKKPDTKGHILFDPIYMKFPEKANPLIEKADHWRPETEMGVKVDYKWAQGSSFLGMELFYNWVVIVAQLYKSIKTHWIVRLDKCVLCHIYYTSRKLFKK